MIVTVPLTTADRVRVVVHHARGVPITLADQPPADGDTLRRFVRRIGRLKLQTLTRVFGGYINQRLARAEQHREFGQQLRAQAGWIARAFQQSGESRQAGVHPVLFRQRLFASRDALGHVVEHAGQSAQLVRASDDHRL